LCALLYYLDDSSRCARLGRFEKGARRERPQLL
jgi:hypothetical protein